MTNFMLTDLDIILGIEEMLSSVSEERTEALAKRHLDAPKSGEKIIGEITSLATRRLWAASFVGAMKAQKLRSESEMDGDEAESTRMKEEAGRQSAYSEVIRDLFFLQLKHDVNGYDMPGLGIRADWKVVETQNAAQSIIQKLFGGM
jgi:hypothetical protein